ncbi:MAG TPA: class I SAM-dependent methyltransferase [Solirubrobacteraceae bacterium]
MPLVYRLLYLVGFTPWDTGTVPDELTKLVEGEGALAAGRALDIGCGTGTQSAYLAKHGWQVTGVDAVERPLREARARAAAGDAPVQWLLGDVTRLAELGLEPGYGLLFDRGCFHGLNAQQRAAYAAGITALAEPGATMLMMVLARRFPACASTSAAESQPGVCPSRTICRISDWSSSLTGVGTPTRRP